MADRLVPTGKAARAVGVHVRTLQQWARDGLVKPALTTPGGHLRWNIADLVRQLREQRRRAE